MNPAPSFYSYFKNNILLENELREGAG